MNIHLIPLDEIKVTNRGRIDFGNIRELADNIELRQKILPETAGLIHPILLDPDKNLIAGGRRLEAHKLLKRPVIAAIFSDELTPVELKELELDENIHRLQMRWTEEILQIADIHTLKTQQHAIDGKSWTIAHMQTVLDRSAGHISNALLVAKHIRAGDTEMLLSKSMNEAFQLLLRRKEEEANRQLVSLVAGPQPQAISSGVIFSEENINSSLRTPPGPKEPITFDLSTMFYLGDCIKIMDLMPSNSFDHIVTDIPYGIEMSNLDTFANIDLVASEHDVEDNINLFYSFLPLAFKLLKPHGFLAFWYDLAHHEKLQALGLEVGFKVQRWPLVWCKTHPCRNSAAQYNYTKATEFICIMRKSSEATLIKAQLTNFIISDGRLESKLYNNPFSKPFESWKFILDAIALPGQTILDPFAGEMSCPRACIHSGLRFTAIELKENHFNAGVNMIIDELRTFTNNELTFINNPQTL